jgi:membrane protease YdiL (CAAX protease family)
MYPRATGIGEGGFVKPLLVFAAIAVGTTTAIAAVTTSMRWTVSSPAWALLAPIVMWAPALARFVTRRTVDRTNSPVLTLRRWGATGTVVVLRPLLFPLAVYGVAYAIAWSAGFARWNPGEGRWTTGAQIAANVAINLGLLGIFGTFTSMGEEIGWRGYLQPRLDFGRVRASIVIVSLCQLAYHAPLMAGAGYLETGSLFTSLVLFAIGDIPITFLFARESYLARSAWPAVFFHSFHNTISQWLFPKFFTVQDQIWLRGEGGLLPMIGYLVLGLAYYLWMRHQGQTWNSLADEALGSCDTGRSRV